MPPAGTEIIYVRDNGAVVSVAEDGAFRPLDVGPGDVMLYTKDPGDKDKKPAQIILKHDGSILLSCASLKSDNSMYLNTVTMYKDGHIVLKSDKVDPAAVTTTVTVALDTAAGQLNINNGNLTVDV